MPSPPNDDLARLARDITACHRCARLRAHCANAAREKRRSFAEDEYWGLPVPGFGDPRARILLVGLAPAAHGANRTGRMFTGDRSGDFLFAALHRAGLANQPQSLHRNDGLKLRGAYLAAAARCAPPDNNPTPAEFANCRPFLECELGLLTDVRVLLALGGLGHAQLLRALGCTPTQFPFSHAAEHAVGGWRLLDCYHPSQQNTFTGRLTPAMMDAVLERAKSLAGL